MNEAKGMKCYHGKCPWLPETDQREEMECEDYHVCEYFVPEDEPLALSPVDSPSAGSVLIDLQDSVDFLRDLQSEWAWKRNTIKKNNREMAELDELVARIDRRLKSNS